MQGRSVRQIALLGSIGVFGCIDAADDRGVDPQRLGEPISASRFDPIEEEDLPDTLEQTSRSATADALCAACSSSSDCGPNNYCLRRSDGERFCGRDCRTSACPSGYTCLPLSTTVSQCVPPGAQCAARDTDAGVAPDAGAAAPDAGGMAPAGDVPATAHCAPAARWTSGDAAEELAVLSLANARRQAGARCGGVGYAPAPPLALAPGLRCAARLHAKDMSDRSYFSHTTPEGVSFSQRISLAGYAWRTVGENIASGYRTPAAVVEGWMQSTGHCRNLMNPAFTQLGVGRYGQLWTQDFGAPL